MRITGLLLWCLLAVSGAFGSNEAFDRLEFYKYLHTHPELSFQEEQTTKLLAKTWRDAGFEVTEAIGGYGVVGLLRNGDGPTLMLRMDTDGLPVEEQTGLPYASRARAVEQNGQ